MATKKPAAAPMDDYQAESDLHHLTRAAQVKADPKRHKAAMTLAKKRMQEMQQATAISPTDAAADAC